MSGEINRDQSGKFFTHQVKELASVLKNTGEGCGFGIRPTEYPFLLFLDALGQPIHLPLGAVSSGTRKSSGFPGR